MLWQSSISRQRTKIRTLNANVWTQLTVEQLENSCVCVFSTSFYFWANFVNIGASKMKL